MKKFKMEDIYLGAAAVSFLLLIGSIWLFTYLLYLVSDTWMAFPMAATAILVIVCVGLFFLSAFMLFSEEYRNRKKRVHQSEAVKSRWN